MDILRGLERDRESTGDDALAWAARSKSTVEHGADVASHEAGQDHGPWLSLELQRLDERSQLVQRRAPRTALAHTIQNKADRAYRRGDALEKRREMMEDWANWCNPTETRDEEGVESWSSNATEG